MSQNSTIPLAPTTLDLTKNPPAPHKSGPAWEHQQKYGYLRKRISGGLYHTVAALPDGSVTGCGLNIYLDLKMLHTWKNIVEVSCGYTSTWGLSADNKVTLTGWVTPPDEELPPLDTMVANFSGSLPRNWDQKVIAISCSMSPEFHMAALREDGKVYAFGYNCQYGQHEVEGWCDIIQVIAYYNATIGVRRDGTVVCCGDYKEFKDITQWTDIERIYTCSKDTCIIGVKYDGTAVCSNNKFDLSSWRNIIRVSASYRGALGLTGSGHVYFAGDYQDSLIHNGMDGYLDIENDTLGPIFLMAKDHTDVYAPHLGETQRTNQVMLSVTTGLFQTMTISSDGSVDAWVDEEYEAGQCNTEGWNLLPPAKRMNLSPPSNQNQSTQTEQAPLSQTQKSSGCCYIATCVYGSYDCPEVWTLRRFRDNTLAVTWYGRLFIKTYYAVSPTLVKIFGNTGWFKSLCRKVLNPMVSKLNLNGVENTDYEDKSIF